MIAPSIQLRPYQRRALDQLYAWLGENDGNPCLVLPTGAGKSVIIAALCREALQNAPGTRILMLTHVRELIEQNAARMRAVWPGAPLGIYSAGLRRRDLGEPITFAGIQSVRNKADALGRVHLAIIDEAHLCSNQDEGGYRSLLSDLHQANPDLRVVGLTATPYRLGHGLVTDGDGIFDDLIDPVSIEELIALGHLCSLRSKGTDASLSTLGLHRRGGEWIESELQAAVNRAPLNHAVALEILARGQERKSWLLFCAGVRHALAVRDELRALGVTAETVTGETPPGERAFILSQFKHGRVRAVTNANVLTTGFDHPALDLIALLRPTESPGLYVQMAGRGLRVAPGKKDCLVLDFAGCVARHGPITAVRPPRARGEAEPKEAPVKVCPQCCEVVLAQTNPCPACGHQWAPVAAEQGPDLTLRNDDIMGRDLPEAEIRDWSWCRHKTAKGTDCLRVTYHLRDLKRTLSEYLCVEHGGYAEQKAIKRLFEIAKGAQVQLPRGACTIDDLAAAMSQGACPGLVRYTNDGKWDRVVALEWSANAAPVATPTESETKAYWDAIMG
jgi:DNA repair protein RadD